MAGHDTPPFPREDGIAIVNQSCVAEQQIDERGKADDEQCDDGDPLSHLDFALRRARKPAPMAQSSVRSYPSIAPMPEE